MDVAVIPSDEVPARFHAQALYEEDFVIAMRSGHPLAGDLTVARYCAAQHLVVSLAGDPHGFVDQALATRGHVRRVTLTVPNFMFALAVVAESDMISALPRSFANLHGSRFPVVSVDAPIALGRFRMSMVVPKVAMADAGLTWLLDVLRRVAP
jgi:DNA-binding transcriptional LysR family regulator